MDFKSWPEVPKEIRDAIKVTAGVKSPGAMRMVMAYAEDYEIMDHGVLRLKNVLVDNSQRHDSGIILDQCFSHVDWLMVSPTHVWTLRPIALEEK